MARTSRRPWLIGLTTAAAIAAAGTVAIVETGTPGRRHDRTAPMTTPSVSPTPSPPPSALLSLRARYADNPDYLCPAAVQLSLSSFGIDVDQPAVADRMRLGADGAYEGADLHAALNGYLHDTPYQISETGGPDSDPDFVLREVAQDVGVLARAPMIAVGGERLPWHRRAWRGRRADHVVVAVGYDRAKRTVTVFDPWPEAGGVHTVPVATLARALRLSGLFFIYRRSWDWETPTPAASRLPSAGDSPI